MKNHSLKIVCAIFLYLILASTAFAQETKIWGCDEFYRQLKLTSPYLKGYDVFELEERLQELGYNPGQIDGVFDQKTKTAVQQLQKHKKLSPSGIVDLAVWSALGENCVQPTSNHKTPPPQGRVKIIIDRDKHFLQIWSNGSLYKQYAVAVGKNETPSPIGEWKVISKGTNWGTGFGTRWIGLNVPWGIYGIHGTNKPWSIGRMASHGCFRMHNKQVEEIFPWIKIGTPVTVKGKLYGMKHRLLKKGNTGQDVVFVQLCLREEKLLWIPADGRFGESTEQALILYQLLHNLPATGQVDQVTWDLMSNKSE
ncbi:peptidoglycan-binding protein [Bacillota bacterium LX-D]|nr:peptidoglycan-binding protein [Bacillota bacterium LX-D]